MLEAELALRSAASVDELDRRAAAWIGRLSGAELVVVLVRSPRGWFVAKAASPAISVDRFGDVQRIEMAVAKGGNGAAERFVLRDEVCVWLEGSTPTERAQSLKQIDRIIDAYAFARTAMEGVTAKLLRMARPRYRWWRVGVFSALLCVPVRLTAIVSGEVVPADPAIVTAPFDGVVRSVPVDARQNVRVGDALVEFDDRDLRERRALAFSQLALARAKHGRLERGAASDPGMRADLAVAAAELGLAELEANAAERRLGRSVLTADREGQTVLGDAKDWAGQAVRTGERIMSVADPFKVRLQIAVPSADLNLLEDPVAIRFFPNGAPLDVRTATLERFAAVGVVDEHGAHRHDAYAVFADSAGMEIGRRGTAAVSGFRVPLGYALLRKPLSALRQWIGW